MPVGKGALERGPLLLVVKALAICAALLLSIALKIALTTERSEKVPARFPNQQRFPDRTAHRRDLDDRSTSTPADCTAQIASAKRAGRA
jgi:hypothetical protein